METPETGRAAKTETIIVRVDRAMKLRIEAAARRSGKSVTTFVLEAAMKVAVKVEAMPMSASLSKPRGRGACPSFFAARCQEAQAGGESSYFGAGHELTRHVASLLDDDLGKDEHAMRLEALEALWKADDDAGVLAWFDRELPRCMAMIPKRRRAQFLKGVYDMLEKDGGVNW